MKINHILVKSFLGARDVDVDIDTPVTIFGGSNYAGKSSVAEAVRAALCGPGEIERVSLKKEYGQLVNADSAAAEIVVGTDHGEASMVLPEGTWAGIPIRTGALPYVLDPPRFAEMKPDERRTFLFWLTDRHATPADVRELLAKRGHASERIEAVLPSLRTGFPDACDFAKKRATEAKGAWRAVTSKTYGVQAAEKWKADKPDYDVARLHALPTSVAAAEERLANRLRELGTLNEKRRAYEAWRKQTDGGADAQARLTRAKAKLATDETRLADAQQQLEQAIQRAGDAPREGLVHDLARAVQIITVIIADSVGVSIPTTAKRTGRTKEWDEFDLEPIANAYTQYEAQFGPLGDEGDPDARDRIAPLRQARDLMQRSVDNDKRDIEQLQAQLAAIELQPDVEAVSDQDIEDLQRSIDAGRDEVKRLRAELEQLQRQKLAADVADSNTQKAAAHHADVVAWLKIADELDSSGIPSELLAGALTQVNVRMHEMAMPAEWPSPRIEEDMSITYGGRARQLLSESEKYRCDTLIALTIALMSELRFVVLDRFDVLDVTGRGDMLALLDELTDYGDIDCALVFGTIKRDSFASLSRELADKAFGGRFTVHWIEAGAIKTNAAEPA